jgi:eukaryotic-like serine/threonine-protein kinase
MAQNPPRPAPSRSGGPASPGGSSSASGTRQRETEKQPGTFFLGRYRVVDEIGVGGMASVHLARMDGPGGFQKWVAIKRIHPHLVEDDQFVDMFLDEARIAAGINHANVAQVFDLGKDDNTYWIAMEYLHGEPLREIMRRAEERRVRISPELASRICSDGAEGLHAAHELRGKNGQLLGLVHRDVTPHNLFLTYEGYTKVVDFGIAKVADRLSSTRAGTLKGKLAYMSPEQVRGAEVDRTTDIFALGVVLWELTTNQRLFRMDTDLDTLEKVQACVVPPPSSIVADYPMELESVVMKALAKRKQDRFQTAREFSRALQNFLMRRGSFVGPEEVAAFVRQVFADRIQKREAHLAWAAEVTSTINVDQLKAGQAVLPGSAEDLSLVGGEGRSRNRAAASPPPAAPAPPRPQPPPAQAAAPAVPLANTSLMDDDEDVPTTVATRDQLEMSAARPVAQPAGPPPRPAAGMPAPPYANGPAQHAYPQQGYPNGPGAPPPHMQQPYGAYPGQRPPAPYQGGHPRPEDRTAAFPGMGEDLGSTVALPSEAHRPHTVPMHAHYGGSPHYSPPMYAQQNPQISYGPQPGSFGNLPPPHQLMPQSQIETALSLPRPDPAALWLAQQEKQRGERRNTGVLIAVVALTALCVIGIGALVYLKFRTHQAPAVASSAAPAETGTGAASAPATAPAAAPTASAAEASSAAPSTSAAAQPSSAPAAKPAATPQTAPPAQKQAREAAAPKGAPAEREEPGFLTIVCNPSCDDVIDGGRSLGPTPIVHMAVKPGQHRLTLKKDGITKVISVIVVSGQVTAQRVPMTK